MSSRLRVPVYRLHKQSGQAVVTLPDGLGRRRDILLGAFGSSESRAEYARVIAQWEASGRQLHQGAAPFPDLTVNELLERYWRWAEQHYRDADGNPSRELENLRDAFKLFRAVFGHTSCCDFRPLALGTLREEMVKQGLCRNVVNSRINRVRRVFKWAVSVELLPASCYQALQTVSGLRRGSGKARETEPIKPVSDDHVDRALPFMPTPVAAMVQLQRLTGMRPGEVMVMRAIDLSMGGPVWSYRPHRHKNQHRGMERVIFLGPQAQEVIKPFLTTDLEAYLFSPRMYVKTLHARRTKAGNSKRNSCEQRRMQKKPQPKIFAGDFYTRRSYRQSIIRACGKAEVPEWSPLQLRHTAATKIRAEFGVEASRVILGHLKVETTQIYAERDLDNARKIMAQIG
jgi:integrase